MKIGYPCINRKIGCTTNSTFRLGSYSDERMQKAVSGNLACLFDILKWNCSNGFQFFRISSDIVPFASHPVCSYPWEKKFKKQFMEIGSFIKQNNMRISMHPDQFVVINSPSNEIAERSIKELEYHCRVLDLMGLDSSARVQIHVGGMYGDKEKAVLRFVDRYNKLSKSVRKRLAIENDDRLFSLKDCLEISRKTGVPVIFDVLHHRCLNNGETIKDALQLVQKTWKKKDGVPMIDYSSQEKGGRKGKHTEHIDQKDFKKFLDQSKGLDFDIMLEIKDKEKSAKIALLLLHKFACSNYDC
ncbi:UV DNA damage repair endonuclease UvsE [Candidatus Micrarchaeota archaeon]|nr:UV DNA damage repair endonuclease UvsE [Candidatus Micrarchaeota archaeon]